MVQRGPKRLGVVAESAPGETRVAATPATVRLLAGLGYHVVMARGAGIASGFVDEAYAEAGAEIVPDQDAWRADIVLKVNIPTVEEVAALADGATLVSLISPALNPDL